MPEIDRSLRSGFMRSCARFPDHQAVRIEGRAYSYADVHEFAARIAAGLQSLCAPGRPRLTGVLGARSLVSFAGNLAALMAGDGFVPLNPAFPPRYTARAVEGAAPDAIIVDRSSIEILKSLLPLLERPQCILIPDLEDASEFQLNPRLGHKIHGRESLGLAGDVELRPVRDDATAYVMFTSGSTGVPKAVAVTHSNIRAFIQAVTQRYQFQPSDIFSNCNPPTFDLAVFDQFLPWEGGGCISSQLGVHFTTFSQHIREERLTVWLSTPTIASVIKLRKELVAGAFPDLRFSLFCGEAMPMELAREWAAATSNGVVENVYGPTELTVFCTAYRWDDAASPAQCENGTVPIGDPLSGMRALVVDDSLRPVGPGEIGELIMTGPQLTPGYLGDAERTRAAFVTPPGETSTFYRTGDRVRRRTDARPMTFLGRVDSQMKVRGDRVEPGEIEALLREVSGANTAVAIGMDANESGYSGIAAFISEPRIPTAEIRKRLAERLPSYLVPRRVLVLDSFPLNNNEKLDRKALAERLSEERYRGDT